MSSSLSLTQTQLFTALVTVLGSFGLASSNGAPIQIIRGQVNRVPEPRASDFVVLWPIARDRLAMNVDIWSDTQVSGSITSNVLTVNSVINGPIILGATIFGAGVAAGCTIQSQINGAIGGVGTYSTSATPDVSTSTLYVGVNAATQETEVTIQADVHGPASADNAARISTLFRDQFAVTAFLTTGVDVAPLYTSEPRQMPFTNGEQQWEERWTIDLCMQANVTVSTTQQFADALTVTPEAVEVYYPA
ncbi:MAG: hypothetical protein P4L90_26100 [Rhodopila sp.]|nr:hypothetical protein [Rhodopila sp.]